MKSALIMTVAGSGLFAGTVFGLLAVQGGLGVRRLVVLAADVAGDEGGPVDLLLGVVRPEV